MFERRFRLAVVSFLFTSFLAPRALAAGKVEPAKTAPAEPWREKPFAADPAAILAAVAALPGKDDAGARVFLEEARFSYDAEGKKTETRHFVLRITSPEGLDEYGSIDATYKPERDEVPVLRARVVQADGRVSVLEPETIVERPATTDSDFFDDRRVRSAPLPGLAVGSVVEWETVEKERKIFPGGSIGRFYLGGVRPSYRYRLEVATPRSLSFAYKGFGLSNPAPKVKLEPDVIVRTWETASPRAIEDFEPNAPADIVQVPYVEFSTGVAWKTISDWYAGVVDEKLLRAPLPDLAVPANAPPFEIASRALALVQRDIRYVSLTFGEGSIIPHDPADVRSRRYGDCKDQSTLLVGLLRAKGIPAHVALLRAGTVGDLEPSLPGLGAFDHAIVYVEASPAGPGYYLDPTSPYHRAGELPRADQNRWALVCKKGTSSLSRTPLAPPERNCEVVTTEVRLADAGPGTLVETVDARGDFEANRRQRLDDVKPESLTESYERALTSTYGRVTVENVAVPPSRDLAAEFRSVASAKKAMAAVTTASTAEFAFRRSAVLSYLPNPAGEFDADDEAAENASVDSPPKAPKERRYDYATHPLSREVVYHVVPPEGFVVRELPPSKSYEFGSGRIELSYEKARDESVDVRLASTIVGTRFTPAELKKLAKARADILEEDVLTVSFVHRSQQLAESGRGKEALELLESEAVKSPKASEPHRRLASLLLSLGFGEAARREAETAAKLDPKSGRAWHELGMVLQHDVVGRLRRPGWDPLGAEKALKKAHELDPDDLEYAADVALTYEFDADGLRYEDPKRLELALEAYRPLVKKLASDSFLVTNFKIALFRAGKFEELAAYFDKKEPKDASGLRAATLLALRGADGLREIRRLVPDTASRRTVLDQAASYLVLVRRYDVAPPALVEAAKGAPDAAALTARAGLLRKMKRFDEAETAKGAKDEPETAVRRFLVAALDPCSTEQSLERFVVRANRSSFEPVKFRKGFRRALLSAARLNGLPFDFYRDFIHSAIEVSVDGDAKSGWKTRYSFEGSGSTRGTTFFMAMEEGEARIVGEAEDVADVCRFAYDLTKKGETESAKKWLDRALDAGGRALDESRPLGSPLFPRFWPPAASPDRASLSLAAAAGILGGAAKLEDDIYKDLRPALVPSQRNHVLLLVHAHESRQEWKEVLDRVGPYREGEKTVEDWDMAAIGALTHLERYDDAIAVGKSHLASHPDHVRLKRQLTSVYAHQGTFEAACRTAEELAKSPEATSEDLNNAAWFSLVAGKADESTASTALKGVNASSRRSYGVLHTLAAVYAEIAKLDEAKSTLMEAIDLEPDQAPGPEDWYVIGRMLESYGLVSDAKAAYKRADRPKPSPGTSAFLAKRRLEKLGS